ncbi:GGDEF domain-containing protein [Kineococcus rubinsiae]|uniref:GGDEF domain-containing protein n=1 Tax=Kineococcus rubinsiae TaxID=2609562 RepID=UPI0027E53FD5|nr:GGDEF domain-containing protein [Kineococcus rubinsiae]
MVRRGRRWQRARRLGAWRALAGALVVLSLACAALVLTGPTRPGPPPSRGLPDLFAEDVRNAPGAAGRAADPTRVPLDQQLNLDAGKLIGAGLVTEVRITQGPRVVVYRRHTPPDDEVSRPLAPVDEYLDGERYLIEVSVAQPADLAALRWRHAVLQVLVVTLLVLAAGGLWVSRRRHAEQERITLVDPLTGAGNRRQLQRLAARALRDPAGGRRHALLLVDLDRFKQLNDRFGHAHGDAALRRLAGALQEAVRPGDHVVRLGGDEFAVLLHDVPGEPRDALLLHQVLQRVRQQLPDLGVSGGGAVWPRDAADLAGLTHAADQAMYADKRRRRETLDLRATDPATR